MVLVSSQKTISKASFRLVGVSVRRHPVREKRTNKGFLGERVLLGEIMFLRIQTDQARPLSDD